MIMLIGNHMWQRIKAPSTPLTSFSWYGVFMWTEEIGGYVSVL